MCWPAHISLPTRGMCVCVCVCVCVWEYLCCVIVAAGLTSSDYKNQRAQQRPSLITPGNVEKFVLTRLHHKKTLLSSQVKWSDMTLICCHKTSFTISEHEASTPWTLTSLQLFELQLHFSGSSPSHSTLYKLSKDSHSCYTLIIHLISWNMQSVWTLTSTLSEPVT